MRYVAILSVLALVVALPFLMRRELSAGRWRTGDPVLTIISPHNRAIRVEFADAFSAWHERVAGVPVKVEWVDIGGTTEIMRYLAGAFVSSFKAWWLRGGGSWPAGGGDMALDRRFRALEAPSDVVTNGQLCAEWGIKARLHAAFRGKDDPMAFGSKIDLLFGGGTYDHGLAAGQGLTVRPWANDGEMTAALSAGGNELFPETLSGEQWRTDTHVGTVLSTFGICYNVDRLRDLGIAAPLTWRDLGDPGYFGQLGVADPTKSGSIAKAFEMLVQSECLWAVIDAGFDAEQTDRFEQLMRDAGDSGVGLAGGVPREYQLAMEAGWASGLRLIQRIGANARYFTDSAGKVPIDVSEGSAAAGVAIDFYGRYQAESTRGPGGKARMVFVTPEAGSSVSADPISLLRGAPHREIAVRFIGFVLSEEGQRLWTYRPGTPGGPKTFALRRLPIRREFYPSEQPEMRAIHERHARFAADDLGDPAVDPYAIARRFIYRPRWTAAHFGFLRDFVRAACIDSDRELKEAWRAIVANGGPDAQPDAMELLGRLPDRPEPLTWASAPAMARKYDRMVCMREWAACFRENYRNAALAAKRGEAP